MSSVPKIDPELMKQLDATAASQNSKVEAVIRLKPDDASQIVPAPEQTETLANHLLERVTDQVGERATHYNVFRTLGSFVVSAPPSFIRALISQPEVAAAVPNRQPESAAKSTRKKSSASTRKTPRRNRTKPKPRKSYK